MTFLKEFYGMNYQEAMLTLLNEDAGQLCPQVAAPREKVKKEFVLPPANENNRRVFAYLLKHRHLDREVLTTFVRSGLVYEDQKYHNATWPCAARSPSPCWGCWSGTPILKNVLLCLDNDQAGQLATRRLAQVVRERGLAVDARVPVNKD